MPATLPKPLQEFLDEGCDRYDGWRCLALPGWSPSMCYPICFTPELSQQEFTDGVDVDEWPEAQEVVVLGQFYQRDSVTQIHDLWAFIVAKPTGDQVEIWLWDDEGPQPTGQSLEAFVASLVSPEDPTWPMVG